MMAANSDIRILASASRPFEEIIMGHKRVTGISFFSYPYPLFKSRA